MSTKRDENSADRIDQLNELNAKIDVLDSTAHNAAIIAREKYHGELTRIRQQYKLALGKLNELEVASENFWDNREELTRIRQQYKLAVIKLNELEIASEESWSMLVAEMANTRDAFIQSFQYFRR